MTYNSAFAEDISAFLWMVKQDRLGECIDHLLFMQSEGFLTQEEVTWWIGPKVLDKFEHMRDYLGLDE